MNAISSSLTFTVPLTRLAHQTAQRFYQEHSHLKKAKKVYLNTLAVYAVNYYLECLGIETNLEASESWNSVMQTLADVADLTIKNRGKLECIPVLPNDQNFQIPAEVLSERIGYVAVRLNQELTEATLLGFVKTGENEELPLNQLQPLEDLSGYLLQLSPSQPTTHLLQWFDEVFESGWQTLEEFMNYPSREFAFSIRNIPEEEETTVRGAKLIDLGMHLGNHTVVLLVAVTAEEEQKKGIQVQLHPTSEHPYLPSNLKLTLLSQKEETLAEVISRSHDNWIQLPYFKCSTGERFSIEVTLDHLRIIETFIF